MADETNKHWRGIGGRLSSERRCRRGQALVEFAIIAFVLSAIVAGLLGILVLALGRSKTISRRRVRAGCWMSIPFSSKRISSRTSMIPIPVISIDPNDDNFEEITSRQVYRLLNEYLIAYEINGTTVMMPLYDESLLILTPERWRYLTDPNDPANVAEIPELNRLLLASYIFDPDVIPDGSTESGAHRYPGAVVEREVDGDTYQTVLIPIENATLNGSSVNGVERTFNVKPLALIDAHPVAANWVAPVTIVKSNGSIPTAPPTFKFVLFYPSQPASTIQLDIVRDDENRIVSQTPVEADDSALDSELGTLPTDYEFATLTVDPQFGASSSRGKYGLGESFAFVTKVRPYRAVFETSTLFRLGASGSPRLADQSQNEFKRHDDESAAPFPLINGSDSEDIDTTDTPVAPFVEYEDNNDQSLSLEIPVLSNVDLQRYFVDFLSTRWHRPTTISWRMFFVCCPMMTAFGVLVCRRSFRFLGPMTGSMAIK